MDELKPCPNYIRQTEGCSCGIGTCEPGCNVNCCESVQSEAGREAVIRAAWNRRATPAGTAGRVQWVGKDSPLLATVKSGIVEFYAEVYRADEAHSLQRGYVFRVWGRYFQAQALLTFGHEFESPDAARAECERRLALLLAATGDAKGGE